MSGDAAREPERRTQAERTATAARRMIRAAAGLIAKQGYSKTTLAQVGREAGYSGGLVSHHFGSKEGLLRQLLSHVSGRFYSDQLMPATAGQSGLEVLCSVARAYLDELVVREERMRTLYVLMGESLGPVSEIGDAIAGLNEGFRTNARHWIQDGIDRGEIRPDVDPDAEAALYLAMLRGTGMQWMAEPGCLELSAVQKSLEAAIRRQLAVPVGPAPPRPTEEST